MFVGYFIPPDLQDQTYKRPLYISKVEQYRSPRNTRGPHTSNIPPHTSPHSISSWSSPTPLSLARIHFPNNAQSTCTGVHLSSQNSIRESCTSNSDTGRSLSHSARLRSYADMSRKNPGRCPEPNLYTYRCSCTGVSSRVECRPRTSRRWKTHYTSTLALSC